MAAPDPESLERARLLFRQLPSVAISGIMVPAFVLVWQWERAPRGPMLLWAGFLLLVTVWRFAVWRRFWHEPDARQLQRVRQFTVSALLTGLAWAVAAVAAFHSPDPADRWVLLAVLAGIGAGAAASLAAELKSFVAFFVPPMLVFAAQVLAQSTLRDVAVGVLVLMFTAAMMIFARNIHRTLAENIRMRLENEKLLARQVEQQAELQRALATRKRFLAAVSHDLRQPVQAFSLLMQSVIETRDEGHRPELLERIAQAARQLREMVSKLLDNARLDLDRLRLRDEWVDPNAVYDAVRSACEWDARDQGIALRFVPARVSLLTDGGVLQRIVQNLVENAIRHSGGRNVLVGVRRAGRSLELRIYDDGHGIAAPQRARLFEAPFQDGRDDRGRGSLGLGLGLSISRALAEQAGHRLELLAPNGRGSCFRIGIDRWRDLRTGRFFPPELAEVVNGDADASAAAKAKANASAADNASGSGSVNANSNSNSNSNSNERGDPAEWIAPDERADPHARTDPHARAVRTHRTGPDTSADPDAVVPARPGDGIAVLLMEDDTLVRQALALRLVHAGFTVVDAGHGREALTRLLAGAPRPDVIVTDWSLGVADSAATAIRSVHNALGVRTPVIVVTGQLVGDPLAAPAALEELAVVRVLGKPVSEAALLDAIAEALAG